MTNHLSFSLNPRTRIEPSDEPTTMIYKSFLTIQEVTARIRSSRISLFEL